jgi:hypothetical protein
MRALILVCIVVVGCTLQPHCASALTTGELVESCRVVDRTAQPASGDSVDISPDGLPCWYYMSAVQNMSALVDSGNKRLLEICPPVNSTVLDFVRIVVRSAEPKDLSEVENPAALILPALAKAFRCTESAAAHVDHR